MQTNKTKQIHTPHHILIGAPLVLTLVFCFSFVLLHPNKDGAVRSSADSPASTSAEPVASATTDLPAIEPAQPSGLTTIEPAQPAGEGLTSDASAPGAAPTGTPQTAGKSGAVKSANPQTSAGGRQITPTTVITVPTTTLQLPNLTNLLR